MGPRAILLLSFTASVVYDRGPSLDFVHDAAISDRRRLPESIGPGVALRDFDGDGLLDIVFANYGADSVIFWQRAPGRFSREALPGTARANGIAVGDVNADGRPDLLITRHGRCLLLLNEGRTFRAEPFGDDGLWTAAVFFDADADGDDDLFLGHFVRYAEAAEPACRYGERFHYCHPLSYPPAPSRLYRNVEGRFEQTPLPPHQGKVFGAVATDVNNDGRLDLFVANDSVANFLFVNQGNLRFAERGLDAGVAYSMDGNPRSGMGVDATDFDNDGWVDLFVANFNREQFTLYRNQRDGTFADISGTSGIGTLTQLYSGWGLRFFDFDRDGDDDLIIANGHPDDRIEEIQQTLKHKEPLMLLENQGGRFTRRASFGDYAARGLAVGDLDNDGGQDIVVGVNHAGPIVLKQASPPGHWLGLTGVKPGMRIIWNGRRKMVNAGGSYLSESDNRVILGLGERTSAEVKIGERSLGVLEGGRYHAVDGVVATAGR